MDKIFRSLRVKTVKDEKHLASIGLEHQAIFHPLKYLYSLIQICEKKGVSFYEHSEVTRIGKEKMVLFCWMLITIVFNVDILFMRRDIRL